MLVLCTCSSTFSCPCTSSLYFFLVLGLFLVLLGNPLFQYKKLVIKSILKSVTNSIMYVGYHIWLQHKEVRNKDLFTWNQSKNISIIEMAPLSSTSKSTYFSLYFVERKIHIHTVDTKQNSTGTIFSVIETYFY